LAVTVAQGFLLPFLERLHLMAAAEGGALKAALRAEQVEREAVDLVMVPTPQTVLPLRQLLAR
jgi:hypothetical protein